MSQTSVKLEPGDDYNHFDDGLKTPVRPAFADYEKETFDSIEKGLMSESATETTENPRENNQLHSNESNSAVLNAPSSSKRIKAESAVPTEVATLPSMITANDSISILPDVATCSIEKSGTNMQLPTISSSDINSSLPDIPSGLNKIKAESAVQTKQHPTADVEAVTSPSKDSNNTNSVQPYVSSVSIRIKAEPAVQIEQHPSAEDEAALRDFLDKELPDVKTEPTIDEISNETTVCLSTSNKTGSATQNDEHGANISNSDDLETTKILIRSHDQHEAVVNNDEHIFKIPNSVSLKSAGSSNINPAQQIVNADHQSQATAAVTENTTNLQNEKQTNIISSNLAIKPEQQEKNSTIQESATEAPESPASNTNVPKISIAPLARLQIKPEISELPDDFLNDLLQTSGSTTTAPKIEPLSDDFFQDIMVDKVQNRIVAAEIDDLEVKHSDLLKEKERLDALEEKERNKLHKKHKKSKKRSHKRSRSKSPRRSGSKSPIRSRSKSPKRYRSKSPHREAGKRQHSPILEDISNKRSRPSVDIDESDLFNDLIVTNSNYGNLNKIKPKEVPQLRIKSELDLNREAERAIVKVDPEEIPLEFLNPQQKKERAIKRANAILERMRNPALLSTFEFTSTIRKLPASISSIQSNNIYENRSPLHNLNNVVYKFNSHAKNLNMEEWGLVSLSPYTSKIAKLIAFDAESINRKIKTVKLPAKLLKIKNEINSEENIDELGLQSASSFFCNATTQTDEVEIKQKNEFQTIDVAIQASNFCVRSTATQCELSKINGTNSDDLPVFQLIRELNENQLMALEDFAELIKEPNDLDMYRLRQRMVDIYKCSQVPTNKESTTVAHIHSPSLRSTTTTSNALAAEHSPGHYRQQHSIDPASEFISPIIQSVVSADGSRFTSSDPRTNSSKYAARNNQGHHQHNNSQQPSEYSNFSPTFRFNADEQPSTSQHLLNNYPLPAVSAPRQKFFGRGGLRR